MESQRFKDACDACGKFDYLITKNNRCLCSECLNKRYIELPIKDAQQLTIYDYKKQVKNENEN